ncbi:MAG: hypothetical protein WCL08_12380, partial [Verrucomicrobiota bacterium]
PSELLDILPAAAPEAVFDFKKDDITGLTSVVAGKTIRALKTDDGWTVSASSSPASETQKPPEKVDSAALEGVLDRLLAIQAGRRTEAHESLAASLKTPLLTLTLNLAKNAASPKVTVSVGHPIKDGSFPATVSGKEGIFLLPEAAEAALENALSGILNEAAPSKKQPNDPAPEAAPAGNRAQ